VEATAIVFELDMPNAVALKLKVLEVEPGIENVSIFNGFGFENKF